MSEAARARAGGRPDPRRAAIALELDRLRDTLRAEVYSTDALLGQATQELTVTGAGGR